jgi:hypothetical protein
MYKKYVQVLTFKINYRHKIKEDQIMKAYEQERITPQHWQRYDHARNIVRVHSTFTELVCTHTS